MELFATVFIDKVEAACFPDCCCQSHHPVVAALSFPQWHQPGPCSGTHLLHSSDRRVRHTHSLTHSLYRYQRHLYLTKSPLSSHSSVCLSYSQSSRCFIHFGPRRPNASIHTHAQKRTQQSGKTHTLFYWCIYILLNKWKREFFALPLFSMTQRMVSLCQWCRKLSLMWKYRQQKKTYWLVWVLFR